MFALKMAYMRGKIASKLQYKSCYKWQCPSRLARELGQAHVCPNRHCNPSLKQEEGSCPSLTSNDLPWPPRQRGCMNGCDWRGEEQKNRSWQKRLMITGTVESQRLIGDWALGSSLQGFFLLYSSNLVGHLTTTTTEK